MTQPPGSWRRLYPAGLAACCPHCPGWPYPHSARAPNLDPGPGSACEVAKAVIPWSPGQNPAAWPGPGPAMRPQPGRSQSRSRAESTASRRLVPRAWRLAGRGVTTAPRLYPAILGARRARMRLNSYEFALRIFPRPHWPERLHFTIRGHKIVARLFQSTCGYVKEATVPQTIP